MIIKSTRWIALAVTLSIFSFSSVGGAAPLVLRQATLAELEQLGLRTAGALVVERLPDRVHDKLKVGDVLAFAGTKALVEPSTLKQAVDVAKGGEIELLIYRDGLPESLAVRLDASMLQTPSSEAQVDGTVSNIEDIHKYPLPAAAQRPDQTILPGPDALTSAIRQGDGAALQRLLGEGADPDAYDSQGMTPLMHACDAGDPAKMSAFVEALLARGASPFAVDHYDRSVSYFAIQAGRTDCVSKLLERGANANQPPVIGYPPPLAFAAALGHVEIMRLLLQRGAEVNGPDTYGRTALMLAADNGEFEAARLLLQHGANANAQDSTGQTALSIATKKRNEPPIPSYQRKQQNRLRIVELLKAHRSH